MAHIAHYSGPFKVDKRNGHICDKSGAFVSLEWVARRLRLLEQVEHLFRSSVDAERAAAEVELQESAMAAQARKDELARLERQVVQVEAECTMLHQALRSALTPDECEKVFSEYEAIHKSNMGAE